MLRNILVITLLSGLPGWAQTGEPRKPAPKVMIEDESTKGTSPSSQDISLPAWFWEVPQKKGYIYAVGISERVCEPSIKIAMADARAMGMAYMLQNSQIQSMFARLETTGQTKHRSVESTSRIKSLKANQGSIRIVDRHHIGEQLTMTLVELDLTGNPAQLPPLSRGISTFETQTTQTLTYKQPPPAGETKTIIESNTSKVATEAMSKWNKWAITMGTMPLGLTLHAEVSERVEALSVEGRNSLPKHTLSWFHESPTGVKHAVSNDGKGKDLKKSCPDMAAPFRTLYPIAVGNTTPEWIDKEPSGPEGAIWAVGVSSVRGGLATGFAQAYMSATADAIVRLAGKITTRVSALRTRTDSKPESPATENKTTEQKPTSINAKTSATNGKNTTYEDTTRELINQNLSNLVVKAAWMDSQNPSVFVLVYLPNDSVRQSMLATSLK